VSGLVPPIVCRKLKEKFGVAVSKRK